jgi:hypothetical protein
MTMKICTSKVAPRREVERQAFKNWVKRVSKAVATEARAKRKRHQREPWWQRQREPGLK